MSFKVSSSAFEEGEKIPAKYTSDGENVSPPLSWTGLPTDTKSIAIICEDPDAPGGTWVHWVFYNLPPTPSNLPENISTAEALPNGARQGVNDFKRTGYNGPAPPHGKEHRYYFRVYALDTLLTLKPKATKADLTHAMQGHILAQAEHMGRYQRK